MYFKWFKLIHAMPKSWKKYMKIDQGNCRNLLYLNHQLIKNNQIYSIEKLKAELYSLSISLRNTGPTTQKYFENFFPSLSFTWKDVYILPCIVTINTRLQVFHYKVLNNALYLNKHLHIFKLSDIKLGSFCNKEDETVIHLFANCSKSKTLWNSLKEFFKDAINLPSLTLQSAIFGLLQTNQELFLILNYLLLLFKYYLYVSKCYKTISFAALKSNIKKRIFWKKIFPNMMKKRKDLSSKSGVKFRFISNHVITFSVGGVWVYIWHYLLCLVVPAGI